MKKLMLASALFGAISLSAQWAPSPSKIQSYDLETDRATQLQHDFDKKTENNRLKQKTNGGIISQRMSHLDVARDSYTGSLRAVYSPIAPDSTFYQEFGTGPDGINIHGFGQTFDPTSNAFILLGQNNFSKNDPYFLDTIYIGSRYRTANPTTGFTNDTLKVTIFYGNNSNNQVWRVGIGYPANTFPGQANRLNVNTPRYMGNSSIGTPGQILAPNKIVIKYLLKDTDTTGNYIKVVPASPINIPAGNKVGVFCEFVPGYTYNPATQAYYISGANADVNNLSWLYLTAQSNNDDTPYFFEALQFDEESKGISTLLYSQTRYNSWTGTDAFRNEYISSVTNTGNLIDFWVHGRSTVGLEESKIEAQLVNLYPNPSTGVVNLKAAYGGEFHIELLSIDGKLLHSEIRTLNANETHKKELGHLESGVYLIRIAKDLQVQTMKLHIL